MLSSENTDLKNEVNKNSQQNSVVYEAMLKEDHILGASRLSSNHTPWRIYRILRGLEVENPPQFEGRLDINMREWLLKYLINQYNVKIESYEGSRQFEGRFESAMILLLKNTGELPYNSNSVLMIITPSADSFNMTWQNNGETQVPLQTKIKAQIRMSVSNTQEAIIWIVCDNGNISEFLTIKRDEEIIKSLKKNCKEIELKSNQKDEPSPDDSEIMDYIFIHSEENHEEKIECHSEVAKAYENFQKLQGEKAAIAAREREVKAKEAVVKTILLRAIAENGNLIMPDGNTLTVIKVNKKAQDATSYNMMKIIKANNKTS